MGERSDEPVARLRLVLDFGESVELDGSSVWDPIDEVAVPAVVLRMPAHRAALFGRVLEAYTRMCRLVGVEVDAAERGPAWALMRAADAAGYVAPGAPASQVTSARRAAAAAVLRAAEDLDDTAMVAVVDAAAWWLDQPVGDEYAWALLGAVTDGQAQMRAYGALLGTAGQSR